jgi:3',5'-cyclic AMP phosphodiesterase CpdA
MRAAQVTALLLLLLGASWSGVAQFQPLNPPDPTAYVVREELAKAGEYAGAQRILRFVQVSDAHILDDDAPYPLRQEPLDHVGPPFDAAQRPQEEFTDEVLDATIRAINAKHAVDAFQFVINTGDNIDNALENELMRFLDIYAGTSTTRGPISGFTCQPDGQSTSISDTANDVVNNCTSLPPALVNNMTGLALGLPGYSAFGNHDALIQGNAPIEPSFQDAAARYGRRFLQQTEFVAMHFAGNRSCTAIPAGSPADDFGHGFGFAGERLCDNDSDNDGYYAFDLNGVRFLVLDTVNDDFVNNNQRLRGNFNPQTTVGSDILGGYADGAIDPIQLAWIRSEIQANQDKLIILFSHHTVNHMFTSRAESQCAPNLGCLGDLLVQAGYATGQEMVKELAPHRNVIAWIGGHSHRNLIETKTVAQKGFWNVESSSLIDYPQESRVIELWQTADKAKVFLKFDNFDHDYQPSKALERTDPQRVPETAGQPKDQNVILWFDLPAVVTLQPLPQQIRTLLLNLSNQTSARVGEPADVEVVIRDALSGQPVSDLNVTWSVTHAPQECNDKVPAVVTDVVPVALQPIGNGTYRGQFTPQEAITHYLTFAVQPTGPYNAQAQILSLPVSGDRPSCPSGSKGLPTAGLTLALGAVAVALLARRRT